MKKILLVITLLLLFPSIVLAKDTCNNNDIKIEEIKVEEKEGYPEELTPVSIDNNKINLNLEMYNVGESITYKIKVKNNSNNDYYFTKDSFNLNTDYLEYEILNDSAVIKSKEEKIIRLRITYKEKIPNDEFNENNMMSITLSDTPLSNPSTKRTISLLLLVTLITLIVFAINRNKKLNKVLIGMLICSIPLSIKALCTVNLEINANITINHKEAIFLPGKEVNVKMKELAGNDISTAPESAPYMISDENITSIKYSEVKPNNENKEEKNIVSTPDSPYQIYMWYEEGTIYWWSESHHPKLNKDASQMFVYMKALTDISGLENFDTLDVVSVFNLFLDDSSLTNIMPLKNWDTRNLTDMRNFMSRTSITSLEALQKWNVSNVTTLYGAFSSSKIDSLNGLEDWDVSKVESLYTTFQSTNLTSLEAIKRWNTINVTDMTGTFQWTGIESVEPLRNWDTSNVTKMSGMFTCDTALSTLSGLENWDTSKVNNYTNMFYKNESLTDVSAINNWDIQKTANFSGMFAKTPIHPEFTKVPGTWNSSGTFIPS